MRKFFVQVVDAETGEPVLFDDLDADSIDEALDLARELGRGRTGRPVRVTHINEEVELRTSWFLGKLNEVANTAA